MILHNLLIRKFDNKIHTQLGELDYKFCCKIALKFMDVLTIYNTVTI